MTKSRVIAALAVSAALLSGCSILAPEPVPSREFVMPDFDIDDWEDSTLDEFVDDFPDLDTSFTEKIDELSVQRNGDLWLLGSGLTGFGDFDTWARETFTIADDGSFRESLIETDDKLVSFSYRAMGDGFIAYFFVSD
jgi:hypothetical protein